MTPREQECYRFMQSGLTAAEIGAVMGITTGGAKTLRKRVNRQIKLVERDSLANRASVRYQRSLTSRRRIAGAS